MKYVFYPKILRQFGGGDIVDLGFGTGGFLRFLKSRGRRAIGIDSNPFLVKLATEEGFSVRQDDLTTLETIDVGISNAVTDNVLEHLDRDQISAFFSALKKKMAKGGLLIIIVPLEKGFERDPTHRTMVNAELIESMCLQYGVQMEGRFFHPFNIEGVGKFFYLNMQVFKIRF